MLLLVVCGLSARVPRAARACRLPPALQRDDRVEVGRAARKHGDLRLLDRDGTRGATSAPAAPPRRLTAQLGDRALIGLFRALAAVRLLRLEAEEGEDEEVVRAAALAATVLVEAGSLALR